MKVIISRPELAALIGNIQGIVPGKPSLPILATVLVEAYNKQLTIRITSLTVSVRAQMMEVKILEEGAIILPARNFFQFIRELTVFEITLVTSSNNDIAYIEAKNSRFRLNSIHRDEFPIFPDLSHATHFSISSTMLKGMLSKSAFAAARDDERLALNGVLMRLEEGNVVFIGTDGKRLSKLWAPIQLEIAEGDEDYQREYLIPLRSVEEIVKIIDHDGSTKIFLLKDKVGIESDYIFLVTKLSLETYPHAERIIPQETTFTLLLHREEMMVLLKQVMPFTSDTNRSLLFTLSSGELALATRSHEVGEGRVSTSVNYSGEPFEMAFNLFFFYEILRHINDETVLLAFTNPYNPVLITDSTAANYVIMPMRLYSS